MRTATIEIDRHVLDEMNRILHLDVGLEDTKAGNTIQTFYADFDNGVQADIKVCNGSDDSSPWVDCVLFTPDGGELTCFVAEGEMLEGEYDFWAEVGNDDEHYQVLIKAKDMA